VEEERIMLPKQSDNRVHASEQSYDEEVDVLVVGSGAGALTAAIVAHEEGAGRVLVIEKSDRYGGTSAMSGGGLWIPDSHSARAKGVKDSSREALDYMSSVIGDEVSRERMSAFAEKSAEMLAYMEANSRLQCDSVPYSDYYPEKRGGKEGHRTHQPVPMHARHLGDDFDLLRGPSAQVLVAGKFTITMAEGRMFLTQAKGWLWMAFMMFVKYYADIPGRLKGPRSRRLTLGNALIGRLRWSMKDKGIDLQLSSPLKELITENGVVTGALIERDGKPVRIKANKGVVLGTGGFEHNQAMRDTYLPQPSRAEWSGSQENNTGDGHIAAEKVGAKMDLSLIHISEPTRPY